MTAAQGPAVAVHGPAVAVHGPAVAAHDCQCEPFPGLSPVAVCHVLQAKGESKQPMYLEGICLWEFLVQIILKKII